MLAFLKVVACADTHQKNILKIYIHAPTSSYTTPARTHTHAHTHAHTQTRPHAHTYTRTHAHKHSTRTHARARTVFSSLPPSIPPCLPSSLICTHRGTPSMTWHCDFFCKPLVDTRIHMQTTGRHTHIHTNTRVHTSHHSRELEASAH